MLTLPPIAIVVVAFSVLTSIRIPDEYERGMIFRPGRLLPGAKGPGVVNAVIYFRMIEPRPAVVEVSKAWWR